MKLKSIRVIATTILIFITSWTSAQKNWNNIYSKNDISRDSLTKKGYTLIFINKFKSFDKQVQQNLINTFFAVYPKEVRMYNRRSLKKVVIIIDPDYKGVAATNEGIVRVNPQWMYKHPEDIDVITHEVMHIVQAYPENAGPGWITEGIADYVRYKMGVDNALSGWRLPGYNSKQSYTDAYRITARFFVWIEKNHKRNLVKKLNTAMRNNSYNTAFWKKETGKTIDQLWTAYSVNPVI
jgi:hypothetical protein